jgi:hypothetical protein
MHINKTYQELSLNAMKLLFKNQITILRTFCKNRFYKILSIGTLQPHLSTIKMTHPYPDSFDNDLVYGKLMTLNI